jgi:hypothetical protein
MNAILVVSMSYLSLAVRRIVKLTAAGLPIGRRRGGTLHMLTRSMLSQPREASPRHRDDGHPSAIGKRRLRMRWALTPLQVPEATRCEP